VLDQSPERRLAELYLERQEIRRSIPPDRSGNGMAAGSTYSFLAPRLLCQAGSGITWQAYAWDRAGLNVPKYKVYGDQGNFGSFKITGC